MGIGVSDSQFHMWRALFALVHADHVVTSEEIAFMTGALEDVPFSSAQRDVLVNDIHTPQNIEDMFNGITEPEDQSRFFNFAHEVVYADGDFGAEEQKIMLRLQEIHVKNTNIDQMIGNVQLSFEGDEPAASTKKVAASKKIAFSFRKDFLKDLAKR